MDSWDQTRLPRASRSAGTNPNLSATPTPSGRSLGQFFAEEVAKPLGLEFYIGLPASVDRNRVAHLHGWSRAEMLLHLNVMPPRFVAAMFNPRSLAARARHDRPWDGCPRRPEPRRTPRDRDTRQERHRHRTVGGQSLRLRSQQGVLISASPRAPSTRWSSPRYHPLTDCATKCCTSTRCSRSAISNRFLSSGSVRPTKHLERPASAARSGSPIRIPASGSPM